MPMEQLKAEIDAVLGTQYNTLTPEEREIVRDEAINMAGRFIANHPVGPAPLAFNCVLNGLRKLRTP
jgi:hypothetical protein